MENKASFKDRFRDARQKRAQSKGTTAKGPLKRYREPATKDAPSTSNKGGSEDGCNGEDMTKEERDRKLMPPPPSLKKKPKPTANPQSASSPESEAALPSAVDMSLVTDRAPSNGIPNDFFETKNKRTTSVLDKQREEERTEIEFLRFQQELEAPLDEMAEREAEEEEQNEKHRQETEAYEQQRRLDLVANIKQRHQQQLPHSITPPLSSRDTEKPTSVESPGEPSERMERMMPMTEATDQEGGMTDRSHHKTHVDQMSEGINMDAKMYMSRETASIDSSSEGSSSDDDIEAQWRGKGM